MQLGSTNENDFGQDNSSSQFAQIEALIKNGWYEVAISNAYRILQCKDSAADCVSDSFEKLLNMNQKSFFKIQSLGNYLVTITQNTAKAIKKRELQNRKIIKNYFSEVLQSETQEYLTSIFSKITREEIDKILLLIDPPRYAEIIRLYYFEKMNHKDIAEKMDISIGNSKTLLSRAIDKFKEIYENGTPDNDPEKGKKEKMHPETRTNNPKIEPNPSSKNNGNNSRLNSNEMLLNEELISNCEFRSKVLEGYNLLLLDFTSKDKLKEFIDTNKIKLLDKLRKKITPNTNLHKPPINFFSIHEKSKKNIGYYFFTIDSKTHPHPLFEWEFDLINSKISNKKATNDFIFKDLSFSDNRIKGLIHKESPKLTRIVPAKKRRIKDTKTFDGINPRIIYSKEDIEMTSVDEDLKYSMNSELYFSDLDHDSYAKRVIFLCQNQLNKSMSFLILPLIFTPKNQN